MVQNLRLSSMGDSPSVEDHTSYRQLIGQLLYLTNTRPDICYSTHQLSYFLSNPLVIYNKAAHRILRYIKRTPGLGLFFPANSTIKLTGFCDADWAGCPDTQRSTMGYCTYLGNSLVSWRFKKQQTISRSSSEVEYRAIASLSCELQWLTYFLDDLKIAPSCPASMFCDNKLAIHIAEKAVFHERTIHIEIDCHLVREKIKCELIKLFHVPAARQATDVFTKPLAPTMFKIFFSKLGLLDIHSPACGRLLKIAPSYKVKMATEKEEELTGNAGKLKGENGLKAHEHKKTHPKFECVAI